MSGIVKLSIILLAGAVLLPGCRKVDQAIALASSSSAHSIIDIAKSDNAAKAAREIARAKGKSYEDDPLKAISDARAIKRDLDRLFSFLEIKAGKQWGNDARLPTRSHYVKYTQNYKSRAIVDFDKGTVTVETVDEKSPQQSLKSAIVTTLLTPDDPRAVDLFSDKSITLTSKRPPYLLGLVEDQKGRSVDSPKRAEEFATHLIGSLIKQRRVRIEGGNKQASYVTIPMVSNFAHAQAEKYRSVVERNARKYGVSPSLVFAVIRTESNFNPFAVSHAPAYGLMQLVPTSGGREAYRHVKGRDIAPSKHYLFDAANNIELGTAYLSLLDQQHLKHVENRVSREYCVISAYNTGAGNVFKAFSGSGSRTEAVNRINSVQPPEVFRRLREQLPYEETRHYLRKVVKYRKEFVSL